MRFGIGFGLLAVTPLALLAQGTGVLAGVVKEDSTGRPIAGAEVSVSVVKRQTLTDAQGRFRLADVAAGAHTVNVRRLGYAPLNVTVQFQADEVVEKTFTLSQSAASLDTLKVLDTHRPLTGRAAFYDRQARSFGQFMDSAQLRKLPDLKVSMLLQSEFNIHPVAPPVCYPMTGRRNNCVGSQSVRVAVGRGLCGLKVMLDGMVVGLGGEIDDSELRPDPRHNWYTAFDVSTLNTASIEKVEVYRRESEVPPEYLANDTQCGLLVLWTRQY
jgi:CarboxypepD_reg-like domain